MVSNYISAETLAERLSLTKACLAKWRREGTGPRWVRLGGAVRYDVKSVDEWILEQVEETAKRNKGE